jgi:drug/metabolite transporter (DMT)-like permease
VRGGLATALLTGLALLAFAANSVICRAALGGHLIDAAGFALIRLATGAATLLVLHAGSGRGFRLRFDLVQPTMLFLYATTFAFAYLRLGTGTGALILFGCVQTTMLLAALRSGERFRPLEGAGLILALGGLAGLVAPGLTAPSAAGSALMAVAGVTWGVYSLRGRGTLDSWGDTTRNFIIATPLSLVVVGVALRSAHFSGPGVALAVVSGAVTSGLGYVVWFAALRGLTAIRAAVVQLAVPALAAAGGVAFLSERVSARLIIAAILILGGVGLAIAGRSRRADPRFAGPAATASG